MRMWTQKYSKNYGKRRAVARRFLAAGLTLTILMLTGCGNADMDPLTSPLEISYDRQEGEKVTVQKGDLTPTFEAKIELSGYSEESYSLFSEKMEEMETLYDAKLDQLLVSEGESVTAGQTLLTFSSEVLDKRSREWSATKSSKALMREHLINLQNIDSSQDYSSEIKDLGDDIYVANQYISDVNGLYSNLNIIARKDGVVSFVNESVRSGFIVLGAPIIKTYTDDGYYVLDKASLESESDILNSNSDMEFKVGDKFKAVYALNEYEVEVIDNPNEEASAGDASSSNKVYFKLVNDVPLKDHVLTLTKEKAELKNVCYVDKRAILVQDEEAYVIKEMEDGNFQTVKVKVGDVVGAYVVIKEGLDEGDAVLIPD